METLWRILDARMTKPVLYGWYHILWLIIPLAVAWLLCRHYHHSTRPERYVRRVVFCTAATVATLEVLHQFNYNTLWTEDGLTWDISWYAFPFQFCNTPMYAGLLTGIFRKGRIHNALCTYLATYAVFAGLCVMIYPGDVFTSTILTNFQTMVCHSSMLTIGIFLYYTGHVPLKPRTFLRAVPVFLVCVAIAVILNETAFRCGLLAAGHTFNMFFISPYCTPSLPVYSLVQKLVPYPGCLALYVLGFSLASFLVLLAARAIAHVVHNRHHHQHVIPA